MNYKNINDIPSVPISRMPVGMPGMDNLLGGGFVDGECILLAGVPGAGKSTLLAQVSNLFAREDRKVLYVCGEENLTQIRLRADRLGTLNHGIVCTETVELEDMLKVVEEVKPKMIIIDSLQMVRSTSIKALPGSPSQTRYCLDKLISTAKRGGMILILVGHSTKTGLIAGLLTLQHMVDATFFMQVNEDGWREVIANKNRFGETLISWRIQMSENGFVSNSKPLPYSLVFPFHGWGLLLLTPIYWMIMFLVALVVLPFNLLLKPRLVNAI